MNDLLYQIEQEKINSEIAVIESMMTVYDKMDLIMENARCDVMEYGIFQEGKIMDDVKEQGKGQSLIKRFLTFIPRLIKAIIKQITNSSNRNKKLQAEINKKLSKEKQQAINKVVFSNDSREGKKKKLKSILGTGVVVGLAGGSIAFSVNRAKTSILIQANEYIKYLSKGKEAISSKFNEIDEVKKIASIHESDESPNHRDTNAIYLSMSSLQPKVFDKFKNDFKMIDKKDIKELKIKNKEDSKKLYDKRYNEAIEKAINYLHKLVKDQYNTTMTNPEYKKIIDNINNNSNNNSSNNNSSNNSNIIIEYDLPTFEMDLFFDMLANYITAVLDKLDDEEYKKAVEGQGQVPDYFASESAKIFYNEMNDLSMEEIDKIYEENNRDNEKSKAKIESILKDRYNKAIEKTVEELKKRKTEILNTGNSSDDVSKDNNTSTENTSADTNIDNNDNKELSEDDMYSIPFEQLEREFSRTFDYEPMLTSSDYRQKLHTVMIIRLGETINSEDNIKELKSILDKLNIVGYNFGELPDDFKLIKFNEQRGGILLGLNMPKFLEKYDSILEEFLKILKNHDYKRLSSLNEKLTNNLKNEIINTTGIPGIRFDLMNIENIDTSITELSKQIKSINITDEKQKKAFDEIVNKLTNGLSLINDLIVFHDKIFNMYITMMSCGSEIKPRKIKTMGDTK